MTSEERARKIVLMVGHQENTEIFEEIVPQIAAQLREVYQEGRMSERLECQRSLYESRAEGFNAAKEKAAGIAKKCDLNLCFCEKRIRVMEP